MLPTWIVTVQPKPLPHALGLPGVPAIFLHWNYPQAAWAAGGFIMPSTPGFRGTETERFWKRVKILDNGCWEWIASKTNGYGTFTLQAEPGTGSQPITTGAHIWSYTNYIGPVPSGKELHHTCRYRPCVNPLHLEPKTRLEHIYADGTSMSAIHARKIQCPKGHPYDDVNTYKNPTTGGRACRACIKAREVAATQLRRTIRAMNTPTLTPGAIIRYRYRGEWEYAVWNGDGTRTLTGTPKAGTAVIQGVWRKEIFISKKLTTL